MKKVDKIKGISHDLMYSMLGTAVMNAVIQLVVYPYLQHEIGAEAWGGILSLLAIVSIMGGTFGTGANYSRMLAYTKGRVCNSDYNKFLIYIAGFSVIVSSAGMYWLHIDDIRVYIGYCILMIVTIFRYYADVEFRLKMNYKGYCFFYLLIGIGYLVGIMIYSFFKSWVLTMLLGELAAVLYVKCRGDIFNGTLKKTAYYRSNIQSILQISGTQLLAIVVLNSDRLLLQPICGGTAVTVFYVATLIGKVTALISAPLNGVLIGYLSRYKGTIQKHTFIKLGLLAVLAGSILTVLCTGVSYIFIKMMYSDIFEIVMPYLWIANAGQAFYFISGTLMVILMRVSLEKHQIYLNAVYVLVFFVLAIPLTIQWKLWGMAWALFFGNVFRIMLIVMLGEKCIQKK